MLQAHTLAKRLRAREPLAPQHFLRPRPRLGKPVVQFLEQRDREYHLLYGDRFGWRGG